jgi:hypothetical protein
MAHSPKFRRMADDARVGEVLPADVDALLKTVSRVHSDHSPIVRNQIAVDCFLPE